MEQPPQPQPQHPLPVPNPLPLALPHHTHNIPLPSSSMATSILSTHYDHQHQNNHNHNPHRSSPTHPHPHTPPQTLSAVPPFANRLLHPPLPPDSEHNIYINNANAPIPTIAPSEDQLTASTSIVTNASSAAPSPNGTTNNGNGSNAFLPPISLSMSMPISLPLPLNASPSDPNRNRPALNTNLPRNCNNLSSPTEAANSTTPPGADGTGAIAASTGPIAIYDVAKLLAAKCTIFKGKVYNGKGHPICGVLNQHDRPCHRIGRCPFHYYSIDVSKDNVCNGSVDDSGTCISYCSSSTSATGGGMGIPVSPPKKMQYKHGWSKEEHYLFLAGLRTHGRGAWKQIACDVKTRNPTQVQSHAQKFYLRQKQKNKNKRSIHDLTLDSAEMSEIEKNFNPNNNTIGNMNNHNHNVNNVSAAAAAAAAINSITPITPITPSKNQPSIVGTHQNNGFDEFAMFNIPNGSVGTNETARSLGNSNVFSFSTPTGIGNVNSNKGSYQYNSTMPSARSQPLNENITPSQSYYTTPSPISTVNTHNRSPVQSHHQNWNSTTTATNVYNNINAETKRNTDALLDVASAHPIRPVSSDALPLPLLYGNHHQQAQHDIHSVHQPEQQHIPIPIHGTTPAAPYAYGNGNNANNAAVTTTGHAYEDMAQHTRYDNVSVPSTSVLLGSDPASGVSDLLNGPSLQRGGISKPYYATRPFRNNQTKSSNITNISHCNSFEPLVTPISHHQNPNSTHNGTGNGNTTHFLTGELHDPQQPIHNHSSSNTGQRDGSSLLTGAVRTVSAAASVGVQDPR